MELTKETDGTKLKVSLQGYLDAETSPALEAVIDDSLDGVEHLVLDLNGLEYVSSAGLRAIIHAQKTMMTKGDMIITGACSDVMDIFDMTGFSKILTFE